jgi:hypothetical protein
LMSVVSVVCFQIEVWLRDGPIPRPESYRLWCVMVCDLKTSGMRRSWLTLGCSFWWARGFLCFVCSGIWYLLPWLQV